MQFPEFLKYHDLVCSSFLCLSSSRESCSACLLKNQLTLLISRIILSLIRKILLSTAVRCGENAFYTCALGCKDQGKHSQRSTEGWRKLARHVPVCICG